MICRPSTDALKFGACAFTVSIIRSATASRCASQLSPFGSCGATCWQKRLATCCPRGARLSSSVRGNQHFDDRLLRPALRARVEVRAFHIGERRRDDDAGGVVRRALPARQAREIGQLRKRDVHAEGAGPAAPLAHVRVKRRGSAAESISFRYRSFGLRFEMTAAARNDLAGFRGRADCASAFYDHFTNARVEPDLDAARSGALSPSPA